MFVCLDTHSHLYSLFAVSYSGASANFMRHNIHKNKNKNIFALPYSIQYIYCILYIEYILYNKIVDFEIGQNRSFSMLMHLRNGGI